MGATENLCVGEDIEVRFWADPAILHHGALRGQFAAQAAPALEAGTTAVDSAMRSERARDSLNERCAPLCGGGLARLGRSRPGRTHLWRIGRHRWEHAKQARGHRFARGDYAAAVDAPAFTEAIVLRT
jgi:hypothetical protein